jgi:uncharacterized protein YggE
VKIRYLVFLTILALIPISACSSDSSNSTAAAIDKSGYDQPRTLSISGNGSVEVFPNLIIISAQVTAVDKSVLAAREEAAETMTALLKSLEKNQIPEKDISTTSFRISERTVWRDGESVRIGFEVTNSLQISITKLDSAPRILDDMITAGKDAIRINSFELSITGKEQYLEAARNKAVMNAKEQAEMLGIATGVKLGKILSINTQANIPTQYPRFGVASMEAAPLGDTNTPIAFGTQNIAATVMIVWEIE